MSIDDKAAMSNVIPFGSAVSLSEANASAQEKPSRYTHLPKGYSRRSFGDALYFFAGDALLYGVGAFAFSAISTTSADLPLTIHAILGTIVTAIAFETNRESILYRRTNPLNQCMATEVRLLTGTAQQPANYVAQKSA